MVTTTALWSDSPRWCVKHLVREGSMGWDRCTLSILRWCDLVPRLS